MEGFIYAGSQAPQDRKNGLPLKGLSISEAYLKGELWLVIFFKPHPGLQDNRWCIACYESDPTDPSPTFKPNVLYVGALLGRQENHVLVSDVEDMEFDEVCPLPSRVRLYLVENDGDHFIAGRVPRFGMSLDGTLKVLPRALFGEGESGVPVDGAAIGFDENTVSVIKGGSEIVKRIAQDRGGVAGEASANLAFPHLKIELGRDSLFTRTDVAAENVFEMVDVMFGPFGL